MPGITRGILEEGDRKVGVGTLDEKEKEEDRIG